MRILVTGGAGFIGSYVVEQFLNANHDVVVIDNLLRGKRENLPTGVPLYEVDIVDAEAVQRVFMLTRPEHVIHQAAQVSISFSMREPAKDARANILGLLNVMEAAVHFKARSLVLASSGGALYGNVSKPAHEGRAASPISPYGISKLAGEHYLRFFAHENDMRCTALRYANVYGPRQDPSGEAGVVAIFLKRMLGGESPIIYGDGNHIRDYVYVEDVARANLLALESEVEGFSVYNVGTGLGTDVNQLDAKLRFAMEEVLHRHCRGTEIPAAIHGPHRSGDLRSSLLDASKIRRELGWFPRVALAEGLKRTVVWFADRLNQKDRAQEQQTPSRKPESLI